MSDQAVASMIIPANCAEATLPGAVRSLVARAGAADLPDTTLNGHAPWVAAELAHLSEEPARAA